MDIFSRPTYRHVVVESLDYCQRQKGLRIYAWVLMTNHLHMVVSAEGKQTVGDILRDFKKFTNKKILKALGQAQIIAIDKTVFFINNVELLILTANIDKTF